ncbi:Oxidoreductase, aldo/keto reductase family [Chitinispirillum alkaliphilum]|nr:Oxidoreductase, aldo/keto reductase family [Chitinispirillum alkaliphilum]
MELSKIIIGAMRFKDRHSAIKVIRTAIDYGFNYVDTSPYYCYENEKENSESWVGEAVNHPDYAKRVLVSAKCSPGNGGYQLGEFNQVAGFGVRTKEQLKHMFNQSLKRQNRKSFDFYQLWTTHTMEQLNEAFKPGGWYDGLLELKNSYKQIGVTTHAETPTIMQFLKTGKFSMVTIPFNVVNRTREGILDYCIEKGIKVIAMNPLAGGFLAQDERLKELALRYLMALPNVHVLIGFSSVEEVEYANWIQKTTPEGGGDAQKILEEVESMINSEEPRCTSCGYCAPCPQDINLGACLSYYNLAHYMNMGSAVEAFREKQWEEGLKLEKCNSCGLCSSRCPNKLPLREIISSAKTVLYE